MTRDQYSDHERFDLDPDQAEKEHRRARRRVSPGKVAMTTVAYGAMGALRVDPAQPRRPIMRKPDAGSSELAAWHRAFESGRDRAEGSDALMRAADSAGDPLPQGLRTSMEGSLDADLSAVRVHTGPESARAAKSVQARAYAIGQDIHFAAGTYAPDSKPGQHLIAHEVAHTVQQANGGGTGVPQGKLEIIASGDSFEHEADRFADAFASGTGARASVRPTGTTAGFAVQCKSESERPTPRLEREGDRHLDSDALVEKGHAWVDRVFEVRYPAFRAAVDRLDSTTATGIEVRVLEDTRRAEMCVERAGGGGELRDHDDRRAVGRGVRSQERRDGAGSESAGARTASSGRDLPGLEAKLTKARLDLAPRFGPSFFRGKYIAMPVAPTVDHASEALSSAALRTIKLLHTVERVKAELGDRPDRANRLDKSFAAHVAMEAGGDPEEARFVFHVLEQERLGALLGNLSESYGRGYAKTKAEAFDTGPIPTTVAGVFERLEVGKQAFVEEDYQRAAEILRAVRSALKAFTSADRYGRARRQTGSVSATVLEIAQGAPLVIDRLLIRVGQKTGGPGRAGLWDREVAALQVSRGALELLAQEVSPEDPKCYKPAEVDTYVDATPLIQRFAKEQVENQLHAEGRTFFHHTQGFRDAYFHAFGEVYGLIMTPDGPLTDAEKRRRADADADGATGFADTRRGEIHIDLDKNLQVDVIIHELLHLYQKGRGLGLGKVGREGATDYFTRVICRHHQIDWQAGYPLEVEVIEGLVEEVGEYVVAMAYFQGNTALLEAAVDRKAPGTFGRYRQLLGAKRFEAARTEIRGAGRSVGLAHQEKTKRDAAEAEQQGALKAREHAERLALEEKSWPEESGTPISGRVVHAVGVSGGGRTRLVINRGGGDGVRSGWRGRLLDAGGRAVPGGAFEVTKVYTGECEGIVELPSSVVFAAPLEVELQPPGHE